MHHTQERFIEDSTTKRLQSCLQKQNLYPSLVEHIPSLVHVIKDFTRQHRYRPHPNLLSHSVWGGGSRTY
jgi:hypothetical protein